MSTSATVPILGPDGQVRSIPQDQASAALAAGGKNVTKMLDPEGTARWVPHDQVDAAVARRGTPVNDDSSFVITPAPGESFADTMKRAAAAGRNVTPQLLQQQTAKGVQDAPIALGAAAVAGPAILGAEAGAYDLGGSAVNLARHYGGQAIQALRDPTVQQAIKMKFIGGAAGTLGVGAAYKFLKSVGLLKGAAPVGVP